MAERLVPSKSSASAQLAIDLNSDSTGAHLRRGLIAALMAVGLAFSGMSPTASQPFRDPIPKVFQGIYARSATACADSNEIATLRVTSDRLAYYEADEYLILGISFEGTLGAGKGVVPMLNGRFTAREETTPLGEVNLQLVMEKPSVLVRYGLKKNGEPDRSNPDRWIRCSAGTP